MKKTPGCVKGMLFAPQVHRGLRLLLHAWLALLLWRPQPVTSDPFGRQNLKFRGE